MKIHVFISIILLCFASCKQHVARGAFDQVTTNHIGAQANTIYLADYENIEYGFGNVLKHFKTKQQIADSIEQIYQGISKEFLLGKYNPAEDSNFVRIPSHMSLRKGLYCHRETFNAFNELREAALEDGINLKITSAMRSFHYQKQIWERKWQMYHMGTTDDIAADIHTVLTIMRYSSMPGTSRHHWGTELDLNSTEVNYWLTGEGKQIFQWLCEHAGQYGFFQPYDNSAERTGYEEERWHWSYKPLSDIYLKAYTHNINSSELHGFHGSYLVDSLDILQRYVHGIAKEDAKGIKQ